jgi:1-acyl-sn-glycerol-3-phosphate acyltransferase
MLAKWLARSFLKVTGWKLEGQPPPGLTRYVLIAAPHTTNWDLPFTLAFGVLLDLKINWVGKHTLFQGPLGPLMRSLGGLPIDRRARHNMVERLARAFSERDHLILVVPAEGTRARTEYWRSGFYHIAREANVPIVLGYLDYSRKLGGLGPAITPTGDVKADMDLIRAFYADKQGLYPQRFGPVQLRAESEPDANEVDADTDISARSDARASADQVAPIHPTASP